jgi:hypothetical protein
MQAIPAKSRSRVKKLASCPIAMAAMIVSIVVREMPFVRAARKISAVLP